MTDSTKEGQTERPAEARERILQAALSEFAGQGLAGARMDRLASAAGVNKALLYYYFESKEKLYEAALGFIAERVRDSSMAVLLSDATPGERVLRAALNHFDRIVGQRQFQSLMQQEMIRWHKGEPGVMHVLVKNVFEPLLAMYRTMVREGTATGELIDADWMQIQLASLGANVFYFLSAPVLGMVLDEDPMAREQLARRRKALLDFLGQAIFIDRRRGAELAAKVYADTPMPDFDGERLEFGRQV